jgi:hypothetical protein
MSLDPSGGPPAALISMATADVHFTRAWSASRRDISRSCRVAGSSETSLRRSCQRESTASGWSTPVAAKALRPPRPEGFTAHRRCSTRARLGMHATVRIVGDNGKEFACLGVSLGCVTHSSASLGHDARRAGTYLAYGEAEMNQHAKRDALKKQLLIARSRVPICCCASMSSSSASVCSSAARRRLRSISCRCSRSSPTTSSSQPRDCDRIARGSRHEYPHPLPLIRAARLRP